jgi:KDO2-lipid IV(A) lauroyltransferase
VWGEADGLGARLSTLALRGAVTLASRAPDGAVGAFVDGLAALAQRVDRRRNRSAREFLRQALGELSEDELELRVRAAWRHLFRVGLDTERFFLRVPLDETPAHFELHASDAARAVLAEERGCMLVTAHLGNWEAALSILPWLGFHPLYGVAKPPKNRYLSEIMQATRERRGVRILSRKGAMTDAPAVLKAGASLGLVIDQRTSGRALLAPFFGRLARCDRSSGVLLKRQKVPILMVVCTLTERPLHYRLELTEVMWPEDWQRAEVEAIVAHLNGLFEREIRRYPEQYVWIHDRYRDTPTAVDPDGPARILRTTQTETPSE